MKRSRFKLSKTTKKKLSRYAKNRRRYTSGPRKGQFMKGRKKRRRKSAKKSAIARARKRGPGGRFKKK